MTDPLPHYRVLMDQLSTALAQGPKTTRDLKDAFCPPWPEWQLNNCLNYIAAVKVPGANHFDPHLVYGPGDPNAPRPEVDTAMADLFDRAGSDALLASVIIAELGERYSKQAREGAFKRLGITAEKRGGQWWRVRGGDGITTSAIAANKARRKSVQMFTDQRSTCITVLKAIATAETPVYGLIDLDALVPLTPRMTREERSTLLVSSVEALVDLGHVASAYDPTEMSDVYTVTEAGHRLIEAES